MSFSHDISSATQMFNRNIYTLSQQQTSKLQDCVRVETLESKSQFFDRVNGIRMLPRTSRHQDTSFTPLTYSRRRIDIFDYECSDIIDEQDTIKALTDIKSATTSRFVEAGKLNIDKVIIGAAQGSAISADANFAITNVAVPAGQKIANGATNMNVTKIKDAIKILGNNDVDLANNEVCLALNWNMYRVLLSSIEFINKDYKLINSTDEKVNIKNVSDFMGVDLRIVSKEFTAKSGNIGTAVLFVKNSIVLGINKPFTVEALKDPTKGGSVRVIGTQSLGAVRLEEEKVVLIDCDETATS